MTELMELGGIVWPKVPFRFKGIHSCDALVIMPLSWNFNREAIACVEDSFNVKAFDLFGVNSFYKRLEQESATVLSTLELASKKHAIRKVFIIQHVDFREKGGSTRFTSQKLEDEFHKEGLKASRRKILERYPHIEVVMLYVRLVNDQKEVEFSEVFPDGSERVRMVAMYRFKDVFTCPVALLICMDFRFRREMRAFTRWSLKEDVFDMIGFPGATRNFLANSPTAWKALKVLYEKHACRKVIAIHHADCGAYAGMKFKDPVEEEIGHRAELMQFREMLSERYSDIELITAYARLVDDGEWMQFVNF